MIRVLLMTALCAVAILAMAADRAALLTVPDMKALPLDVKVLSEKTENGVTVTELTFAGAPFNNAPTRIYGWYARPAAPGTYPAILDVHGAGLTVLESKGAIKYAQAGFACLAIDWCGAAKNRKTPRTPPYSEFESPGNLAAPTPGRETPPWKILSPEQDGITNGVRFALRGLQFLRSRQEVDRAKVCLVGTSAGAHLSLIVAGLDPTLKAVAVKYGEGFIRDLPGYFGGYFGPIVLCPKEEQDAWLAVLDPKHGIPNYKAPILVLSGTDDIFFWMPIVLKTYREIPSPKRLIMNPNDNHTQVGNQEIPIRYFKAILGTAPAFPEVASPTVKGDDKGMVLTTKASGPSKGLTVSFAWKRMPLASFHFHKNWQVTPGVAGANGEWTATLSASAQGEQLVAYAIVEDETGAKAASDTAEYPAYPAWRGLPQTLPQPKAQTLEDGNYVLDPSFEGGPTKRGRQGSMFLNYVGAPKWDDTGANAHTGKTAVALTGGDKNYLACGAPGEGGKKYRLAGYFRAERDGVKVRLQINWGKPGGGIFKFDLQTPSLLTEYKLCEMIVDAPADTTGPLLIISGGSGVEDVVWMDDLYFGEYVPKADEKAPAK